jgi:Tfp pilus assembly protein PilX
MKEPSMQRGVALIIVLVLLAILTMLIIAGAGTAVAELTMAGNEQHHQLAANAASDGIEQALGRLQSNPPAPTAGSTSVGVATIRYVGAETGLPQSSAEKLEGHHYVVESRGSSLRGAVDQQTQGVLIVVPLSGVSTVTRIGNGLTGGSGP